MLASKTSSNARQLPDGNDEEANRELTVMCVIIQLCRDPERMCADQQTARGHRNSTPLTFTKCSRDSQLVSGCPIIERPSAHQYRPPIRRLRNPPCHLSFTKFWVTLHSTDSKVVAVRRSLEHCVSCWSVPGDRSCLGYELTGRP